MYFPKGFHQITQEVFSLENNSSEFSRCIVTRNKYLHWFLNIICCYLSLFLH
jgi:hypothetical protein